MSRAGSRLKGATRFALFLALFALSGCLARPPSPRPPTITPDPRLNFHLTVLNCNADKTPIDITVSIDGRMVAQDDFPTDVNSPVSIPPSKDYPLELSHGTHTIEVTSRKAGASLRSEFTVNGEHWATVGYECWSGRGTPTPRGAFEFYMQDSPIRFV